MSVLALFSSTVFAKAADSHTVAVTAENLCSKPISVKIYNNWGSVYSGEYTFNPHDQTHYFFNSNNDEEYYTLSYKNAVCKIDYPMIRDYWHLNVYFDNCDTKPTCKVIG